MYNITKEQSEFENEWILKIDGSKIGTAEVVFLTDTSRSVNGRISVFTGDRKLLEYTYDGESTGKAKSVADFIKAVQEYLGDTELSLSKPIDENREHNNIVLIDDVNEDNVDGLMEHLQIETPFGWESQTPFQRVGYLQTVLREEADKKLSNPMYDLVQKSKLPPSLCSVQVDTK